MNPVRQTPSEISPPAPRRSTPSPGCQLLSIEQLAEYGRRDVLAVAAERNQLSQRSLEQALGRAGIPRRFLGKGFDGYCAETAEQEQAVSICRGYSERFAAISDAGHCLVLAGRPGTGKTHLACAILEAVLRQGYSGVFLTISEALRQIRATYSPRAERTESEAFDLLLNPDLLVLDEVGVAIGDSAKRQALLFDVLNGRYANVRPTILIGNLTADEMSAYVGERIMDRILESGSAFVPFTWPSHRARLGRSGLGAELANSARLEKPL